MHDDDGGVGGCSRKERERAWDPLQSWEPEAEREEEGERAVTTLARFVSEERK
jgi:hypothetical protein